LVAVLAAVCDLRFAFFPPLSPSINFICSSQCLASSAFPEEARHSAAFLFLNSRAYSSRASENLFDRSNRRVRRVLEDKHIVNLLQYSVNLLVRCSTRDSAVNLYRIGRRQTSPTQRTNQKRTNTRREEKMDFSAFPTLAELKDRARTWAQENGLGAYTGSAGARGKAGDDETLGWQRDAFKSRIDMVGLNLNLPVRPILLEGTDGMEGAKEVLREAYRNEPLFRWLLGNVRKDNKGKFKENLLLEW